MGLQPNRGGGGCPEIGKGQRRVTRSGEAGANDTVCLANELQESSGPAKQHPSFRLPHPATCYCSPIVVHYHVSVIPVHLRTPKLAQSSIVCLLPRAYSNAIRLPSSNPALPTLSLCTGAHHCSHPSHPSRP
jgi:hypothetical protein